MGKRVLLFAVLALVARCAGAAGWAREEIAFGAHDYLANTVSFFTPVSSSSLAGVELAVVKNPALGDAVWSVRLPWVSASPAGLWTLRPFYYHPNRLVDTSAAGLYVQRVWALATPDPDVKKRLAFGLAGAAQDTKFVYADGSSSRKTLPELAYEFQFQLDYFKQFYLALGAAAFQYLRGVKNTAQPEASLDQNQLSYLGAFAAETDFPMWSAGFDYTRTMPDDPDSNVFLGYHYVEYMRDTPGTHVASLGMRMKIVEKSNLELGYNLLAPGGAGRRNYYRAVFNLAF